ncbi:MAG: hypothetical protein V3U76_05220 [Granulosicoccus sp.]
MNNLPGLAGKLSVWTVLIPSVAAWLALCYWAVLHKNNFFPESRLTSTAMTHEQLFDSELVDSEPVDIGVRDDASVAKLVLVPADVGDELIVASEQNVSPDLSVGASPMPTDPAPLWRAPERLPALAGPIIGQQQKQIWTEGWRPEIDLVFASIGVESNDSSAASSLAAFVPATVLTGGDQRTPENQIELAETLPQISIGRPIEREPLSKLTAIALQIRFPQGIARPGEVTTQALDRLYEHLFIYSDEAVSVVVSSHEYDNAIEDRNLSRKRGGAIVRYLVDRGLPEARFMVGIESGLQLPSDAQRVKVTLGARN